MTDLTTSSFNILMYIAWGLIAISLVVIFYPILSGKICSWNPPCGLKEGYDCKTCNVKKDASISVLEVILELVTFGVYTPQKQCPQKNDGTEKK
jgi:hypothetical protein